MPFLVSPGVNVREIDLTTIVPAVSTTEGALGGVFRWGPIDQRVLIDSETELVKRFGKPTNLNAETWFTAASFLGYGNRLYISRAANTTGVTPTVTANVESSNGIVTLATGNTSELSVGLIVISSANSGVATGATIASIINSTAFSITDTDDAIANTTNDAIQFVSNTAFSAVANTAAVANLEYQIVKNEDHFTQKDGTFDTDVKFVARFPGELGNSLKISVCGNSTGYSSTINLSSYGTRTTIPITINSNTATVRQSATSNTNASANATALKALLNVTDLIEVGNTLIGTQFMKITAIGNTTVYGNAASNVYVSTTGNSTVLVTNSTGGSEAATSNTDALYAGMVITAGNTFAVDAVVNNVINSTAFNTTVAISANLVTNATFTTEVTVSPAATYTINFEDRYALSTDYTFVSNSTTTNAVTRYWEFYPSVDSAPGQSDYVINFGNSSINSDEMHVVVSDEGGKITGVPGTILEVYRAVSRATDAKTIDGGANYWRTVINDQSQYVYAVNDIAGAASAAAENLVSSTLDNVTFQMSLGRDGKDESNIEQSILLSAYDKFASAEDIDISLILQGKARSFTLANYLIDNIAEKRKDCIVLISPQKGDVVNNIGNEAEAVVNFRNNIRSTSYAVMDSGYKYMYDRYNDIYRWIPLNGDTAGLCVRTDQTNDPWWSPAGFNRGQIKNIVKLAYNPRQADRDTLYKAGVNPVVTFPGQGTVLFGDKTLLAKPSAFDRINVRRLFIVLEKAIATASKFTLFEFNDAFTRSQFKNLVVPYLRDVQGRRGITDFLVVCDSTNNTAEVIDRNEFVGDIYIKPARSINFITLNFVAVRTGVNFSEVVGQF
jgi:hypothetical protein